MSAKRYTPESVLADLRARGGPGAYDMPRVLACYGEEGLAAHMRAPCAGERHDLGPGDICQSELEAIAEALNAGIARRRERGGEVEP